MIIIEATKESECCCSCHHNIREQDEAGIYCECSVKRKRITTFRERKCRDETAIAENLR